MSPRQHQLHSRRLVQHRLQLLDQLLQERGAGCPRSFQILSSPPRLELSPRCLHRECVQFRARAWVLSRQLYVAVKSETLSAIRSATH